VGRVAVIERRAVRGATRSAENAVDGVRASRLARLALVANHVSLAAMTAPNLPGCERSLTAVAVGVPRGPGWL
jgi:hypothetical protein